jgi:hypothetical protein
VCSAGDASLAVRTGEGILFARVEGWMLLELAEAARRISDLSGPVFVGMPLREAVEARGGDPGPLTAARASGAGFLAPLASGAGSACDASGWELCREAMEAAGTEFRPVSARLCAWRSPSGLRGASLETGPGAEYDLWETGDALAPLM